MLMPIKKDQAVMMISNSIKNHTFYYIKKITACSCIREHAIPLFIDADILPVTYIYYKSVVRLMHNINNNHSPPNPFKLF